MIITRLTIQFKREIAWLAALGRDHCKGRNSRCEGFARPPDVGDPLAIRGRTRLKIGVGIGSEHLFRAIFHPDAVEVLYPARFILRLIFGTVGDQILSIWSPLR